MQYNYHSQNSVYFNFSEQQLPLPFKMHPLGLKITNISGGGPPDPLPHLPQTWHYVPRLATLSKRQNYNRGQLVKGHLAFSLSFGEQFENR